MRKKFLKWNCKRLYLRTIKERDGYNCGHKMLLVISSKYYNDCKKFNKAADYLSAVDENCPSFRYKMEN